jgi:hypothetical protein
VSDTIKNLISAIAVGDAAVTQDAFNAAMAEKVSASLEAKRAEVASTMFKVEEPVATEEPAATEE